MSLTREEKAAQVDAVRESFSNASATVLVDFRGVNVELITDLRARFREAGVEYKVVKNNIVRKAIEGSDLADNDDIIMPKYPTRDKLLEVTFEWTTQPFKFTKQGWPRKGVVWKIVKNGNRAFHDFQSYESFTPEGIDVLPFK